MLLFFHLYLRIFSFYIKKIFNLKKSNGNSSWQCKIVVNIEHILAVNIQIEFSDFTFYLFLNSETVYILQLYLESWVVGRNKLGNVSTDSYPREQSRGMKEGAQKPELHIYIRWGNNLTVLIIIVTTLGSRGRALTSSGNRRNHSCFYDIA